MCSGNVKLERQSAMVLIFATDLWCSVEPSSLIARSSSSLKESVDAAVELTDRGCIVWRITDANRKLLMDRHAIEEEYLYRKGRPPDPNRSVQIE